MSFLSLLKKSTVVARVTENNKHFTTVIIGDTETQKVTSTVLHKSDKSFNVRNMSDKEVYDGKSASEALKAIEENLK